MHFAVQLYLSGVSAVGGPDVRNLVRYFRERVQHGLKEFGCSAEFRKCKISLHQWSSMKIILPFLVSIFSNYGEWFGSGKWPIPEYSQRLGFQSHRTDLVCRARETKNEGCKAHIHKEIQTGENKNFHNRITFLCLQIPGLKCVGYQPQRWRKNVAQLCIVLEIRLRYVRA